MRGAAAKNPSELRRAERELVDFGTKAALRGLMHEIRVINISALGLMARIDADVRKGDKLIIELPHVRTVDAIVRWVEDGRIGTEFVNPVAQADYALMLVSIPKRQTAW
ncbi:MAG: PilZ domain-containing protein [Sphingobium phenoxybenzoativorans]